MTSETKVMTCKAVNIVAKTYGNEHPCLAHRLYKQSNMVAVPSTIEDSKSHFDQPSSFPVNLSIESSSAPNVNCATKRPLKPNKAVLATNSP